MNHKLILLNIAPHSKEYLGDTVMSTALQEITSCSLFHELINLVNGVQGNIELLEDAIPTDKIAFYRNSILFLKVLTFRLRDIDDFTKISIKKFKHHIIQFDLQGLFIELKGILNDFANFKRIELSIKSNINGPSIIITDRFRLLQILVNSVYTALESIEYGSICITTERTSDNYICVMINIKTNERKKVISLFDSIKCYQKTSNGKLPIKNIEGISLISTVFICNELGKGMEFIKGKNTYEMRIIIKDGFNIKPHEIPAETAINDNIGKTVISPKRKLDRKTLKSSSSINYFIKLCSNEENKKSIDRDQVKSGNELNVTDDNILVKTNDGSFEAHKNTPKNDSADDNESSDGLLVAEERFNNQSILVGRISSFKLKSDLNKLKKPSTHRIIKKTRKFTIKNSKKSMSFSLMSIDDDSVYSAVIADDNFVNTTVLKNLLRSFKINALPTKDGLECVNEIKGMISKGSLHRVKIVFMDMQMPVMDGIEATTEIIRLVELHNLKKMPIIGVSSDNSEDDKKKFLASGINEFISKPISKDTVGKLIMKYAGV
jgi:CheY-like chemotaxis protein